MVIAKIFKNLIFKPAQNGKQRHKSRNRGRPLNYFYSADGQVWNLYLSFHPAIQKQLQIMALDEKIDISVKDRSLYETQEREG